MVRTTLVLAAIALGLLAYILLIEKDTLSSRELQKREHSVLPEMIRDKVDHIEIQRKGVSTVLERRLEVTDEAGLWRVTAPYEARADRDAVDTLLGELEWMDARRLLTDLSDADRKRFGFDNPRYRVRFRVGSLEVTALVGNESPRGDGIYVQGRDRKRAFIVGKDLVEALDKEPEHYHTKELHEGLLVATTTGVVLKDAAGTRAVQRREDRLFQLSEGGRGLASGPDVTQLIDGVDALRASRFIATGVTDLSKYGLEPAELDLTLHRTEIAEDQATLDARRRKDPDAQAKRVAAQLRLRAGAVCGEHAEERYIAIDEGKDIFCALQADLAPLRKDLASFRERRALALEDTEVAGVRIDAGAQRLSLEQSDGLWSFSLTRGKRTVLEGKAREGAVDEWLAALRATVVEDVEAGPLGGERVTLTFTRRKALPEHRIEASQAAALVVAQRADEPFTVALPPAALEVLAPSAARFRSLTVATRDLEALTSIELTRDGVTETAIAADGGGFNLTRPTAVPGDRARLGELARLLSKLEAVRFVADAPEPEHGLSPATATVKASFGKDALSLRIGAATEGGRFARLDEAPGVFVVPERLWDQLAQPVVSPTVLAVPLEGIRAVAVTRGDDSLKIEGDGDAFTGEGMDAAAARALAEAVATLRASAVTGHGVADPSQGFDAPHARIVIQHSSEGPERVLLLGGPAGGGGRHARRADLAVGFVLPESQIEALLSALR